jgi:hypothetical protein
MEIEDEQVKDLLDTLEVITKEVDNLKAVTTTIKYKEDTKYLFSSLGNEILNNYYFDSIIHVDKNNNVKYITEHPILDGRPNFLIIENKGYHWRTCYLNKNELIIRYSKKYDIPDHILNTIQKIPESNIDNADSLIFKLYHLLKKGYKINIIEVKDN